MKRPKRVWLYEMGSKGLVGFKVERHTVNVGPFLYRVYRRISTNWYQVSEHLSYDDATTEFHNLVLKFINNSHWMEKHEKEL